MQHSHLVKDKITNFFDEAVSAVKAAGYYEQDIAWQSSRDPQLFSEEELLRNVAWVIINSGFRNTTARKLWPGVEQAFYYFESARTIVQNREECIRNALKTLNHRGKIEAMATAAEIVLNEGFETFKLKILADPIPTLRRFPYIGKIVVSHLAKNLGFQMAKPDRHLSRISTAFGFSDVQEFCSVLSTYSGLPINCVDLVLWRFAAITPRYLSMLPS